MSKERYRIKSEYFQLNKRLLEELSTKADGEYTKTLNEETDELEKKYITLTYTLQTKTKETETESFKEILNLWDPDTFTEFEIYFHSKDTNVRITITRRILEGLDISVSGTNLTSIRGLTKTFEEIIEKYKSKNEFFHKSKAYAIYIIIPLLIGLTITQNIYFSDNTSGLETEIDEDTVLFNLLLIVGVLLTPLSISWIFAELFRWFFPKIEIEGSTKSKIKNYILGGMITLGITLTGNAVFFWMN